MGPSPSGLSGPYQKGHSHQEPRSKEFEELQTRCAHCDTAILERDGQAVEFVATNCVLGFLIRRPHFTALLAIACMVLRQALL